MVTRMSSLFLRTLREDPADAETPSHRLLVRAGYVRRVAPGIYSWLPLGKRLLENVTRVVREEMNASGAQEVLFPALLPREYYETTNRWTEYGQDIFRLVDRKGGEYLLGPTHEEMVTTMVKSETSSYKDFPVTLYQIQTKYRDEVRPRAGIIRGREFVMKDSYSFDLDDEGLQRSYDTHRVTYQAIFERLGLSYVIVSAMAGAMGGSKSEEFLATSPTGEDTYVACHSCGFAANTEAVVVPSPPVLDASSTPAAKELDTPDTPTIDTLVARLNELDLGQQFTAAATLKNVCFKVRKPGADDYDLLVVGVPGDRDVDMKRLEAVLAPATVEILDDFAKHPGLVKGYIGPQILSSLKITYLVDPRVVDGTTWVTGANKPDTHAAFVVAGRDFTPDGVIQAAEVRAGDACPTCGSELSIDRGIEMGHIFQLGRKYTDAFEVDVLGADGKPVRPTMGCYGIGVSRAVAAVVEQSHDDRGIIWPASISPFDVHIVPVGKAGADGTHPALDAALSIAAELEAAGKSVIVDDRTGSPGEKFADADLIGVPVIVIVGKGLVDGVVEVKDRATGERDNVELTAVLARLTAPLG